MNYYQPVKKIIANLNDQRRSLEISYNEFYGSWNHLVSIIQDNYGVVQSFLFILEDQNQPMYPSELLKCFGQKQRFSLETQNLQSESEDENEEEEEEDENEEEEEETDEEKEENICEQGNTTKIYYSSSGFLEKDPIYRKPWLKLEEGFTKRHNPPRKAKNQKDVCTPVGCDPKKNEPEQSNI